MPNRILREGILTSERVNTLAWPAEVFYRRLISVVDDFGRYYAKPELLRAACYPLQLDKVGNSDIGKWLLATEKAGLVRTYTIEGKAYLELLDFRQQVRAKESKFPGCIADATQVSSTSVAPAHLDGDGDVDERKTLSGKPDAPPLNGVRAQAVEVLEFLNAKAQKAYRPVDVNLELIVSRLKEGASVQDMKSVIAKKVREWSADDKMKPYLRPATLFNRTKFAQYVGELVTNEQHVPGM